MHEEEQDAMIRRLADQALHPPPVPREEIWARISAARRLGGPATWRPGARRAVWIIPLGIAALMALAFGLGRVSVKNGSGAALPELAAGGSSAAHRLVAAEYLGHAEVFLTDFRAAARTGRPDSTAPAEARRLLSTARLLLDSKAAEDVRLRALLEDLELVLAEIAQLPSDRHEDVNLITDGLEWRGMLGRLRSAVPAGGMPVSTQGVL
jgi:hypothetical protein